MNRHQQARRPARPTQTAWPTKGAYLRGVGAPFHLSTSSCHVSLPKTFRWTNQKGAWPTVVMDGAITQKAHLNGRADKYAWVCESMGLDYAMDLKRILSDPLVRSSYKAIFISDQRHVNAAHNIVFCPAGSNTPWIPILKEQPQKTKTCSMFASAKAAAAGHRFRIKTAGELKSRLDLFGGAAGSPRLGVESGSNQGHPDKTGGMNPYRFSVVMENTQYPDYYTEKITDCFASWTVPIYWGCPSIDNYFDADGIIQLTPDFDPRALTDEMYQSRMDSVRENNQRVRRLVMADDYLYDQIRKRE